MAFPPNSYNQWERKGARHRFYIIEQILTEVAKDLDRIGNAK
jgi:hypothetical protein